MSRVSALKPNPVVSDLAHLVVAAMERKGYQVDRGPGEVNIVYVEGMNPDGTANADEANKWNDLRLLIRFEGGAPRIIGEWSATTEPGRYYTDHPTKSARRRAHRVRPVQGPGRSGCIAIATRRWCRPAAR